MKSVKRNIIIVFTIAFIFSISRDISSAMATDICGGIYSDTTWTVAESPYNVICDVVLFPGYTLTIEPDVTILFDPGTKLTIRGSLNAIGIADSRITFTSASPPDTWVGIQFATNHGGKGLIEYADFSYASMAVSVECCWGVDEPAIISHSTFRNNAMALSGYAGNDVIVRCSTFEDNTYAVTSADKKIYNSVFINNDYGLYQTERISVYSSTFIGHQVALWGGRGEVKYCDISNNTTGIQAFFEGFDLSENTIANNEVGVILGAYDGYTPPVEYNNIYDNVISNMKNSGVTDKYVPNNWWGTTDLGEIAARIYDGFDDIGLGIIYFEPILTQPVNVCKADFDGDKDVDGSDLAVFAADFERTDCNQEDPCEGDFDCDNGVDCLDLAVFAADFGRTDCPLPE